MMWSRFQRGWIIVSSHLWTMRSNEPRKAQAEQEIAEKTPTKENDKKAPSMQYVYTKSYPRIQQRQIRIKIVQPHPKSAMPCSKEKHIRIVIACKHCCLPLVRGRLSVSFAVDIRSLSLLSLHANFGIIPIHLFRFLSKSAVPVVCC